MYDLSNMVIMFLAGALFGAALMSLGVLVAWGRR
jgi:hypothetical protein